MSCRLAYHGLPTDGSHGFFPAIGSDRAAMAGSASGPRLSPHL